MNIPEELLPVVEWWETSGRKTVAICTLALVAAAGYFGWKYKTEKERFAAGDAVISAYGTEALEKAVRDFGGTAAGPALKQRLAKSYFDDERYEEALAIYEELKTAPVCGYEDVPAVGAAECLEALGRYAEAGKEYAEFIEAKPKSSLVLQARAGDARVTALLGDKAGALEKLDNMEKDFAGSDAAKRRIEKVRDAVKRMKSAGKTSAEAK
ncbi:MAG: hypothetical protein IKD42_01815 [Kiritimatiellae bacterium]|nr:hypothetical protein [Kiritimatiellia bacterium]